MVKEAWIGFLPCVVLYLVCSESQLFKLGGSTNVCKVLSQPLSLVAPSLAYVLCVIHVDMRR